MGNGSPKHEFLNVEDFAGAMIFALENTLPNYLYNIGAELDLTTFELSKSIQEIVGFAGEVHWETYKPNRTT